MNRRKIRIRSLWTKAVLMLFILAASFGTGRQIATRIRSKKPVVTKSVEQLILELQEKDTSIHQAYVQWWFTRPSWFQKTLGPFAPTSRAAVRQNAARTALGSVAPDEPIVLEHLNRVLRSKSISGTPATIAFETARMLGTLATETNSAVDILAEMLPSTEGPLKWELISVLGRVSAKRSEAVRAVISALDSPDPIARGNALLALGGSGAEAAPAISKLIELYRQEQAARIHETSTEATASHAAFWPQNFDHAGPDRILQTFGRIGPAAKPAIPLCAEIYANRANRYRLAAAISRWKIDQSTMEVLPVFLDGTKSGNLATRQSVAANAAQMGSDALPIMKQLLHDNDLQIRRTIIAWLSQVHLATDSALPFKGDSLNPMAARAQPWFPIEKQFCQAPLAPDSIAFQSLLP